MQKKKIANLIMVLIIAMLAAGGGLWAFSQRDAAPAALGTEYHIQKLNECKLLVDVCFFFCEGLP